jgi:tetratricopeptide (TPR) repeat protein
VIPWLIAAAALLCHARTLWCGWIWDDDFYVWNNPALRSLGGLYDIWFRPLSIPQYYPLVHTTYWLEYRLWGDRPAGYHAVNVLLHATSAGLLWLVLRRLRVPGAWLGPLLFAVHPLCVESVAWVTERKNTLSLCLAVGALLAWLRFRDAEAGTGGWRWYGLSLGLFAAALLAKTVTVSLVGVLFVITWWQTGRITRRDVRLALPYLAIGLPLALVTVWLEKHHVGAGAVDWGLLLADRFVLAGRIICFYAAKLVWPQPLAFFYDRWQVDSRQPWQWLFPAAVVAAAAAAWGLTDRLGRGPLAAILLFAGCLFPALGFFDVYPFKFSFVADHFAYHAAPVFLTAVATAVVHAGRRLGRERAALGAGLFACGALAAIAWSRTAVYHDLETLCTDTLAKNPRCWAARNILAPFYIDRGRFTDADRVYAEVRDASGLPPWPHDRAMLRYNHARAVEGLGRTAEAERLYREAIALDAGYAKPRSNLAKLLADAGRREESLAAYGDLLKLPLGSADRARACFNLGTVLADAQAWAEAEDRFREAVTLAPAAGAAWEWLGIVVLRQGRVREAIADFERAATLAGDAAAAARARGNLATARRLARDDGMHTVTSPTPPRGDHHGPASNR